jgi:hypothetical protein
MKTIWVLKCECGQHINLIKNWYGSMPEVTCGVCLRACGFAQVVQVYQTLS